MRHHLTKTEVVSLIYSMVSPLCMSSLQLWLLSLSSNYSFNWNNYLESVKETSKSWGPSLHQSELQPPRLRVQTKTWISQPSISSISGFLDIRFKPKSSSEFDHVARATNPSVFRQAEETLMLTTHALACTKSTEIHTYAAWSQHTLVITKNIHSWCADRI